MADSGSSPHSGVPVPVTPVAPARVKDPVCGMMVDPQKAARAVEYAGEKYHFCSVRCGERFAAEPEKFIAAPVTGAGMHMQAPVAEKKSGNEKSAALATAPTASQEIVRYTCPMDPDI